MRVYIAGVELDFVELGGGRGGFPGEGPLGIVIYSSCVYSTQLTIIITSGTKLV